MDPIDRELHIINSLFVRAEYYAMSAVLFNGRRKSWREDKARKIAKIATRRTKRLLNLIDETTSDEELIAKFQAEPAEPNPIDA